MNRPIFTLKMLAPDKGKLSIQEEGEPVTIGKLKMTRHQLDLFMELLGKGEQGAKARFEMENMNEVFYGENP